MLAGLKQLGIKNTVSTIHSGRRDSDTEHLSYFDFSSGSVAGKCDSSIRGRVHCRDSGQLQIESWLHFSKQATASHRDSKVSYRRDSWTFTQHLYHVRRGQLVRNSLYIGSISSRCRGIDLELCNQSIVGVSGLSTVWKAATASGT
jgi:hypothetical protein